MSQTDHMPDLQGEQISKKLFPIPALEGSAQAEDLFDVCPGQGISEKQKDQVSEPLWIDTLQEKV
jgi:hypothetical protein